jgi:hypothetical protein
MKDPLFQSAILLKDVNKDEGFTGGYSYPATLWLEKTGLIK